MILTYIEVRHRAGGLVRRSGPFTEDQVRERRRLLRQEMRAVAEHNGVLRADHADRLLAHEVYQYSSESDRAVPYLAIRVDLVGELRSASCGAELEAILSRVASTLGGMTPEEVLYYGRALLDSSGNSVGSCYVVPGEGPGDTPP